MTANAKQAVQKRLEQIKDTAVGYALNPKQVDAQKAAHLAEEAAALGLELLEEAK